MSITDRKEREKEKRRQEILKAAKAIFFRHGFEHSSMDMVADRCQLAKGTLYLYFKSKEELYLSLMEDGLDMLHKLMEQAIEVSQTVDEKLLKTTEAYYDFTQKHKDYFQIMTMLDSGMFDKVAQEKVERIRKLQVSGFEKLQVVVEDGITQGIFPSDLDAKEAVLMSWAGIWGGIMLSTEKRKIIPMFSDVEPKKFVMKIAQSWLDGLKKKCCCCTTGPVLN
ncbi:MAG: TetR/AcrR family transcriptional regulator [Chlorobiales bacterium]|nr:TetR/AcrR family transcriptional regulator [Chlorobiales bacterium]